MLKLLAYFDNQEIWYELLHDDMTDNLPAWLQKSLSDQFSFESVMRTLVEYCLVEVQTAAQSYGMHSCVHDWTLGELNRMIDPQLYWYAFGCVAASVEKGDWESLGQLRYARVSRHGARLAHHRFEDNNEFERALFERLNSATWIMKLLRMQKQFSTAEWMYARVLAGSEKSLGPDHISTLGIVHNLGGLYADQGKLAEAEKMYRRALTGCEKALGPDHISTLGIVNNLGLLYADQGKLAKAEEM